MTTKQSENIKEPLLLSENSPKKPIHRIYYLLCFTNILLNIDQGVLPACTNELMADLNLEELRLGMLGSFMYIGLIGGSFIAGYIFQRFSCKKVILINLLLMAFCLSFFTFTSNFYILAVSRIFTGFFQVFLVIFFPVWVDIFGENNKTIWISILQVGVPLGTFLGYILTVFSVTLLNWKWGFWLQIILLIPSFIAFCLFPEESLDTQNVRKEYNNDFSNESLSYSLDIDENQENEDENDLILNELDQENPKDPEKITYLGSLLMVIRSKIFLCTMLGISSLYFIVTGIQFWMTDYLRNVLDQDKNIVFLTYSILSITAPTLGALFGGIYVNKKGGYNSPNALKICLQMGIMAVMCAYPFPFIPFYTIAVSLLWLLLFFGGAMMPVLTGIMISSVPRKLRAFGNSTAQIFLNLLGFLPSPFLYGLVCGLTGGRSSRWGMVLIMFWSIFGLATVGYAFLHDKRKRKAKRVERKDQSTEQKNHLKPLEYSKSKSHMENNKGNSISMNSHRKYSEINAKSFENKQNDSSNIKNSSHILNLSLRRSIISPLDFSGIQSYHMNSMKEIRDERK